MNPLHFLLKGIFRLFQLVIVITQYFLLKIVVFRYLCLQVSTIWAQIDIYKYKLERLWN